MIGRFAHDLGGSESGHSRHFERATLTSGLPPQTDINRPARLVRFVPGAAMALTYLAVILPAGAREAQADQKAKLKGENRPPSRHIR